MRCGVEGYTHDSSVWVGHGFCGGVMWCWEEQGGGRFGGNPAAVLHQACYQWCRSVGRGCPQQRGVGRATPNSLKEPQSVRSPPARRREASATPLHGILLNEKLFAVCSPNGVPGCRWWGEASERARVEVGGGRCESIVCRWWGGCGWDPARSRTPGGDLGKGGGGQCHRRPAPPWDPCPSLGQRGTPNPTIAHVRECYHNLWIAGGSTVVGEGADAAINHLSSFLIISFPHHPPRVARGRKKSSRACGPSPPPDFFCRVAVRW